MKDINRLIAAVSLIGLPLLSVGCTSFQVKDTAGIREAIRHGAESRALAESIKARYEPTDDAYKQIASEYDTARSKINGYLTAVSRDIELHESVNVPLEDYTKSDAQWALATFNASATSKLGARFDPVLATAIATFAVDTAKKVIDLLVELDKTRKKLGVERATKILDSAHLPTFQELSPRK